MAPRSDSITMDSFKAMDNDEIIENNENDDPAHIETVLSHELMKMSVHDRELIQEEIHGVRSLAAEETPEFLEQSLDLLQWELDQVIPPDKKYAFRKSQQLENTYVNTEEFRLRFLRCELFDAPKAAVRLCKFLDLVLELYGEYALQRPIRITDFTKLEMKYICKGRYQVLPFRDRGGIAGRRILSFFPDAEWEAIPPYLRNKILIYYTWVLGEDVDVQREGIVAIVWFDKTFQMSRKPAIQTKDRETMSVRASAIHCCTPDTPFYRLRRSVMTMRIGEDNRSRLAVHLGDSVEVLYKLHSYGIPTDHIPITSTGKIKTTYLKQWIKIREFIESPSTPNALRVIESPYLSDILFRKGSKFATHPGNAALRAMIATKVRDEVMEDHKHCPPEDECKIQHPITRLGLFVSAILREIRETSSNNFNGISTSSRTTPKASRFLVYNDKGFWEEIQEEDAIRMRVEHIARGVRSTIVKNHRSCAIFAGRSTTSRTSSPTVSPKSSPPKVSSIVASTNIHPSLEIGLANTRIMSLRRTFQNQNGGTSMFRCLDHLESTTPTCLARDIKKRRLELE